MKTMEPDQAHFESIPWCRSLLHDPKFKIIPTYSRYLKHGHEDSLLAQTLNTPSTVAQIVSTYRLPPSPSDSASSSSSLITEVRCLLTLGSGMNGGPDRLHGGMISALMDDVVGILMTVNRDGATEEPYSSTCVTAWMKTNFERPVATPQTLCFTAVLRRWERRKFWIDAEMRDEQGVRLASSESLWIQLRKVTTKEKL